jgi:putative salt-induced outer membrane protein
MKVRKHLLVLLIFLVLGSDAFALEKKWSDAGEISFVDTGGNSNLTTLSAKNLVKYRFSEKVEGSWKIGALYGTSDNVTNSENYMTELRADYLFTNQLYAALIAGWLKNTFAGIDARYYVGPSVGYKFLTGPRHSLKSEASLNYTREEYTDNTHGEYLSGKVFALYEYSFSDKNKFSQSVEYIYDFSNAANYNMNSVTAIISALSDNLSLKSSYEVKYDNEPVPSTLDKTDTILGLTLLINY